MKTPTGLLQQSQAVIEAAKGINLSPELRAVLDQLEVAIHDRQRVRSRSASLVRSPGPKRRFDPWEAERLRALGYKPREIAKILGCTAKCVYEMAQWVKHNPKPESESGVETPPVVEISDTPV